MWKRFARQIRLNWTDSLGLACFLGFAYCCLFGCGLSTPDPSSAGMPTNYALERIWAWSGIAEALGAAGGLAFLRRAELNGGPARRTLPLAALVLSVAGAVLIWFSWYLCDRSCFKPLYISAGVACGCAIAFYTAAWGRRLSSFDEARIELMIPLAFPISFVIYLLLLLCKPHSLFNLAVVACLCAGTFACLMRTSPDRHPRPRHAAEDGMAANGPVFSGMGSFGALVASSWIQIAYFRVISSPAFSGDSFTHYLYPFLMACAASWAMLLLCINISRHLNITLAYRWSMPLFVLAYIPLFVDYDDRIVRMIAYSVNFLGMFGVQFGCWLGASKFARRTGANPLAVFCVLALGEGLGIALGCGLGLFAMFDLDPAYRSAVSIALLAVVQFAAMAAGFNPNWVFKRTEPCNGDAVRPARAPLCPSTPDEGVSESEAETAATMDALCRKAALALQETFALSDRETEVAALLLAGRSRPFIRDELLISLNTVGVHVRKIYGKCGVHSQQELIDLARSDA